MKRIRYGNHPRLARAIEIVMWIVKGVRDYAVGRSMPIGHR